MATKNKAHIEVQDVVDWPTPLAAYVHVPFCRHRCGYCNFSVLAGHDDYADAFLKALEKELYQLRYPRPVNTIFIGGGTPTHLDEQWLAALLELLQQWFLLTPGGEYSVEANPTDIEPSKLQVLKQFGVNRISLGVQSFNSNKLNQLERDHSAEIASQAIRSADAVIGNVSIDLIFAAPGESLDGWNADLKLALSLPIKHLSTYGLTFEKGTQFWNRLQKGELREAGEDLELRMYQDAIHICSEAGWKHYEVSNFSLPGYQCRHNMAYWEGRGWYAAGPGAAAFVNGYRTVNHRSPTSYIRKLLNAESPIAESELLTRETWARERLMFGLRVLAGADLQQIHLETGFEIHQACAATIMKLRSIGMLEQQGNIVRLTEKGLFVSDSVLAQLL